MDRTKWWLFSISMTVVEACFRICPWACGTNVSIHPTRAGSAAAQSLRMSSKRRCKARYRCNRTECCCTKRESRIDGALYLYSWPFLSTAARERMAGIRRTAGLRLSVPRLERTHHGRVLRTERNVPDSRRLPDHREDHE